MTYVETIEPRLTPHRPASPVDAADTLVEWCRDLHQELAARLRLITPEDLRWRPHADANNVSVTAWHVSRWLDVLATRAFTGQPALKDIWHTGGFRDDTGYEPDGIGYLGLGTLTGYSPQEMRAVPDMSADLLERYLDESSQHLAKAVNQLRNQLNAGKIPTPYQTIGSTLQGSFGHVGEIDALVALRSRLVDGRQSG